ACAVVGAPATDLGHPAVRVLQLREDALQPTLLDEQRGDQAPGDERRDVGHHHVRQRGAQLLYVYSCPGPRRRVLDGGLWHEVLRSNGRRPRWVTPVTFNSMPSTPHDRALMQA